MAQGESYLQYIEQQLSQFPSFKARKMFGGIGFFRDEAMFGLIKNDVFMLRTDPNNLGEYTGQAQFSADMRGKAMTMPYHAVPEKVVENPAALAQWAQKAAELALLAKAKKKK